MNTRRLLKATTAAVAAAAALALGSPAAVAAPAAAAQAGPPATTASPASPVPSVPSALAAQSVYIWASNVNVRYDGADADCVHYPSRASCVKIVATVSRTAAEGMCQHPGEEIVDSGYRNRWWTLLKLPNGTIGWVNNIYIQGGEKIAGVPDCGW
ncbi:peptidase M23 [Streptomyces erythrochromogenes]|uniref:peptidase M23 n=1 Tax=Streptomyces erythrochromogenes TaxID=285574 RepID=UPI00386C83EE|nr:peptidase M23 [Streptomyces erythrochromogenes]